jgi:hypothetical protein
MNKVIDAVEKLLDLKDGVIGRLHFSWDKSDCSEAGIVKILLIQVLREHIRQNGEYADQDQVALLKKLTT